MTTTDDTTKIRELNSLEGQLWSTKKACQAALTRPFRQFKRGKNRCSDPPRV